MTAIISLNQGVVDGITWDDGCFFCASNGASCAAGGLNADTMLPIDPGSGIVSCFTDYATCYSSGSTATATPSPSPGNTTAAPASPCDLQVFVVWSGTDSNGNYLTSQNKRFSRFRQFSTASLVQSAINIGTAGLNAITGAVNP